MVISSAMYLSSVLRCVLKMVQPHLPTPSHSVSFRPRQICFSDQLKQLHFPTVQHKKQAGRSQHSLRPVSQTFPTSEVGNVLHVSSD